MARLLLAIYLLTSLVGNGSFVMCEEPDSSLSLESLLQPCCGNESGEDAPATETEECDCRDLSGSILFTHLLRSSAQSLHAPALLPADLPAASLELADAASAVAAVSRFEQGVRPDLPGGVSCPRVLRT